MNGFTLYNSLRLRGVPRPLLALLVAIMILCDVVSAAVLIVICSLFLFGLLVSPAALLVTAVFFAAACLLAAVIYPHLPLS